MGLELFTREKIEVNAPERVVVYGRSGIGKSRFGIMLPDTEKWGEILVYAADDNSEFLRSIPASVRNSGRIHVVKPRGKNHQHNFQQFCMQDWKRIIDPNTKKPLEVQPYAKVKTLVVDTFTTVSFRTLQQLANEGVITREEHFQMGDPKDGGWALPTRSDYQGIDSACKSFVDALFDKQAEYNIIFLCHEDSKEVSKGVWIGGPSVPGRKLLEDIPGSFNTVIRLIKEPTLTPKNTIVSKVVAITENDGRFVAKLREGDVSDDISKSLAKITVERNPVSWWEAHDTYMAGQVAV